MIHRTLLLAGAWALLCSVTATVSSLCEDEAATLFTCDMMKGRKSISLCAAGEYVQYRFGKPGAVEIALPETPGREGVQLVYHLYASAAVTGIRFHRGEYTYTVSSFFGGKPPGEFDQVTVTKDGNDLAELTCEGAAYGDELRNIQTIFDDLKAKGYEVVEP